MLFLSTEDIDDPLAMRILEALVAADWSVEHSPRNPGRGPDARWSDWYSQGCADTLGRADVSLGVCTPGWDGSSWMAHEGETALELGVPLFLWNPRHYAIPLGMRRYAERPLDDSISVAIAELDAYRAAPLSPLDRHLARLCRFIKRLAGCPEWSDVLVAENLAFPIGLEGLVSPTAFTERFNTLLVTCSWVNLHAVGLIRHHLVVSVETPSYRGAPSNPASIQLSGPESRVADLPGWELGLIAHI
ncbi:hypothetical protein CCP4SC76_6610001 [Gammaproteobacteria bacterium]